MNGGMIQFIRTPIPAAGKPETGQNSRQHEMARSTRITPIGLPQVRGPEAGMNVRGRLSVKTRVDTDSAIGSWEKNCSGEHE